jgi:flagellin-like protein
VEGVIELVGTVKKDTKSGNHKSRGVSPVIGIILLVVITVVIAAVIGTFVFSLGQSVKPAPKAQFILEDAEDMLNNRYATDAILLIRHVGGDPIKCEDIKFIIKDLTNGRTWVLEYDGGNYTGAFFVPPTYYDYPYTTRNLDADPAGDPYNTKIHTFIDLRSYKSQGGSPTNPVIIHSPVILAFGEDQDYDLLVNNTGQFGDPNYGVKNGGILSVGDTIVLIEGNVTLYGVNGDGSNDYYGAWYPPYQTDSASSWLGNLFYQRYGRDLGMWFGDVFDRSNTPADIEVTIVHVPTNSIIYQGVVKVQ